MDSTDAKEICDRAKALEAKRGMFLTTWQEMADVMLPQRANFITQTAPGSKRTSEVYDSTPMQGARMLAGAVGTLLMPKTQKWLFVKPADKRAAEMDDVKAWLNDTEERMQAAMYNPMARFLPSTGVVDQDVTVFGTGAMYAGESGDRRRLSFRALHLRDILVARSEDGVLDTVYLRIRLTARQAVQRFGEDKVGEKVREALTGPKPEPDREFTFWQAVEPRTDRKPGRADDMNMRFRSRVVEEQSGHLVGEGGFRTFPFIVPQWDASADEEYGWGPGRVALPDAKTLQSQGKTILRAGHMAVDPPRLAANDSIVGRERLMPGKTTIYDIEAAAKLGGRPPIFPFVSGAQIPLAREMQQDGRELVWAAFFRNVLNLPIDAPQMTAFEIAERKEEMLRTAGPVFSRLEADYPAATGRRVFDIMLHAGAFADPPEALKRGGVRVEVRSPIEVVRKQIEAMAATRTVQVIAPFIEADPGVMDNFDADEIARSTAEVMGMPAKQIRPKDQVEHRRQQRAQAQQAQAALAMAEQAAGGLKDAGAGVADLAKAGQGGA